MFLNPEAPIEKHRANLPHWQQGEVWVFLTWRLADSLPESVIRKIRQQREDWEKTHPQPWDEEMMKERNRLFTMRYEDLLDDCHGSCCLREAGVGKIVAEALLFFDGERYEMDSFVVMPNHVHALFRPLGEHFLEEIAHSWKSFSAKQINKLLGGSGTLWQKENWDRLIRSQSHFDWTRRYIAKNPRKLREGDSLLYEK